VLQQHLTLVCCEQDNRNLKEQNDELNGQIINLSIQGAKNLFSASFSESLAAEISSVSRDEVSATGYCLPQTASSQGGWWISSQPSKGPGVMVAPSVVQLTPKIHLKAVVSKEIPMELCEELAGLSLPASPPSWA